MREKIKVYYGKFHLGTLKYVDERYEYNSSAEEQEALKVHALDFSEYRELIASKQKKSKKLFAFFVKIINQIKQREDLMQQIAYEGADDYDLLVNYSKLKQYENDFHFAKEN
ncbi:MAG: hypothetical protein IJA69_02995 [Clostridia bacterium]|nr:hypothetical protein [Clostridia bacterium]